MSDLEMASAVGATSNSGVFGVAVHHPKVLEHFYGNLADRNTKNENGIL